MRLASVLRPLATHGKWSGLALDSTAPLAVPLRSAQRKSWYWLAGLTVCNAIFLLAIALVFASSRLNDSTLAELFLPAIACVFALPAWRLLAPTVLRGERISILCLVGMTCYGVRVVCNPVYFIYYDEFL